MNYQAMKKADLINHIKQFEAQAQANPSLQVTSCQIFPFREGSSLGNIKAMASIVLSDEIQVRGLRIKHGENGLFVSYPNDPFYKGEDYRSICTPITRALREHIESVVLAKYNEAIAPTTAEESNG